MPLEEITSRRRSFGNRDRLALAGSPGRGA
jgi:hypothetical protein